MRSGAVFIAGLAALAFAAPANAAVFTVTNGSSDSTASCDGTSCPSLRAALAASEATKTEADTINVPAGTININNDLVIQSDITVNGVSARSNIIDGGVKYRGFRVTASGNAKINHFTIRNGAAGQGDSTDGGGIVNLGGFTQLTNVRVTSSQASRGGGIANVLGVLTLQNVLVDNNTASGEGGGIANIGGPEVADFDRLLVADSTVFNNTSGRGGVGGVSSHNRGSLVSLDRTTVADNDATLSGVGGVGILENGTLQVEASIVARNLLGAATSNCGATKPTSAGSNVENEKECDFERGSVNPALATALSNAGGEVDVLAITAASPAVDLAPLSNCNAAGITDQRGKVRPQGAACDAGAYELDVAPTMTINSGPTGTINVRNASFTFSTPEPGVTVQCRLTGPGQPGTFSTCSSATAQSYASLADGSYTFSVRALDGVFTDPPTASRSFVVDATFDTTITGGPTGPTNDNTPTFTFTGTGGAAGFECRFDTATFTGCTSPFTPTAALGQGAHTFAVRALSAAGAPDPTPATRSFTVDTVAPDTTLTGGPTGTVSSASATFTYGSNESPVTFQCNLDNAGYATCPASYTGLAQGAHTLLTRAVDAASNADASPASRTWTVDTVAPDTLITAGPTGAVSSTSATFTYNSTESPATFQCSLDGAGFATCPASYTGLSQGSHTFQVRATDQVGNADGSPASRTWTVDTVAPNTTITALTPSPSNDTTPTWNFSSEAGATFECRVDAAAFSACSSPFTSAALAAGNHTFEVRAIDSADNPDVSPATQSFVIDLTPPSTTLTLIASPNNDATPTFTFSSEVGARFECRVDAAAFAACTSPHTTALLGNGSHTFEVRAIDTAGNVEATPKSQTFVIDTSTPDTTITDGPAAVTNDATPTFTFTGGSGTSSFQCRVDGSQYATCSSPFTTAVLAAGSHTVDIRALSSAGTPDASPATRTFTVDLTAPNTTLTPIATPSNDATPTFSFTATEAGSTFQCRVDVAAFAPCTTPFTIAALSGGSHSFDVRAIDPAGNTDGTPATQTFVIDLTLPDTTIDGGPAGPTNDATPTFTFSSSETSTFECRVDVAAFTACTSPVTTAELSDGAHTIDVRATDSAGNRDASPASRAFTVDTTPPAVPAVVSGPAGPTTNAAPEFAFSATDTVSCKLDGPGAVAGSYGACASPKAFSALAPGDYVFSVRSVDAAGNEQTTQRAFTITVVQQATPTPTPTPSATPTPTPTPPPVEGQSVGMNPVGGKVLIKLPGSSKFVPLDPSVIKNGAEVDTRNGVVEITRSDGGVAKFYDGIFKLSQSGGITTLTLTEKLTGCPKTKKKASAAAKKPKTRKLWGDGKGKFRTRGQYSAATVRGTKWLVQDTCTTTLTRVAQGVVTVEDFAKKKKVVVRQGKRYTASAKKR
jgi:hypothetical protein